MATRTILEFPDPRLRTQAKPVENVNDDIRQLVSDMFETMDAADGIGLAASQIDEHVQVIVMNVAEDREQPLVFINPKIVASEGNQVYEEGCLSVPGIYAKVDRAKAVTVSALNAQGEAFELKADGLLAVCIQHEMDHLQGKLFVDYLSPLKRQRVQKKLEKQRRQESAA